MRIDCEGDRAMIATLRRRREPRPWLQLLNSVLGLAGERAELLRHAEQPWASVTFSGIRHTVALQFTGADTVDAAEAFIAALPEHEFTIAGRIVADAAIVSVEQSLAPEARTVIEAELLLIDES